MGNILKHIKSRAELEEEKRLNDTTALWVLAASLSFVGAFLGATFKDPATFVAFGSAFVICLIIIVIRQSIK